MKLIVAIVQDRDANDLLKALTEAGHRATRLASSGGFLRGGNTTVLIGTEEPEIDPIMEIIRHTCKGRRQVVSPHSPAAATGEAYIPFATEVKVGGAIVFVLQVDRFEKF